MADFDVIPRHIAIIMDGNGRWAEKMGRERLFGHRQGIESVRRTIKVAAEIGVEYLTLYAFSTENWGRNSQEVAGLMSMMAEALLNETAELRDNGVKLHFIGDIAALPEDVRDNIKIVKQIEVKNPTLNLVIAINYSSRQEIVEMVRRIADQDLKDDEITERVVEQNMQTHFMPDPELLIRTSGEQRLSNFMLWQLSYAELYFTPVLWPEFGREEFIEAIEVYNRRERRFGLTK